MLLLYLQKSFWVRASHMDTRAAKRSTGQPSQLHGAVEKQLQAKVNSLRWTRRIRVDQRDGPSEEFLSEYLRQQKLRKGKPPTGYWPPLNKEAIDIRKFYKWLEKSGLFDSTAMPNMAARKAHTEHPNQVAGVIYMNACSNLGLRGRRSKWRRSKLSSCLPHADRLTGDGAQAQSCGGGQRVGEGWCGRSQVGSKVMK